MDNKKIKEVKFVLENCESILVPYNCFKKWELIKNKYKDGYAYIFNCIIEDNSNIRYSSLCNTKTSPLQRLEEYNDICWIVIFYENEEIEKYGVSWYGDNPNTNKNQSTYMPNYKTLHINIKPYIKKYNISDLFKFPLGTKFRGSDKNTYVVGGKNDKYIESGNLRLYLEEKYFEMSFIKIKQKNSICVSENERV